MKKYINPRIIEMIKLRVELNKLGAKLIEIESGGVKVQCPSNVREEVTQLLADAGFVTAL